MVLADLFKRLGYPKHADAVYHVLNKTSEALSVTAIARETHLARMTIYRCLAALSVDGIILTQQIGKRSFYRAGPPQRLLDRARLIEQVDTRILEQEHVHVPDRVPPGVRFLSGAAGVRAAFDDVITHAKKGETFFRYTSETNLSAVNAYLAGDYRLRRDKKKLERLVISNAVSGSQKRSRLERFIKYIPAEASQFEQNIIQLVYGKRVSIIDLEQEEVMIIENERFADFQKVIFRLLYQRLTSPGAQ